MKMSVFILSACLSLSVFASTVRIVDIMAPEGDEKDYLVLASNGLVYELSAKNTDALEEVRVALENDEYVELERSFFNFSSLMNQRERITDVKKSSNIYDYEKEFQDSSYPTPMDNFTPTVLGGVNDANNLFKTLRTDTRRRSECFNRAHVWSYEMFTKYNFKSSKIYIFFTRKYIREYRYKWWFHVAPLTKVSLDGVATDIVFDREFARGPQQQEDWKNDYIYSGQPCIEVDKYTDYSLNQEKAHCFIMKTSMYYWEPRDMENLEKTGKEKTNWIDWEIKAAYKNAIR